MTEFAVILAYNMQKFFGIKIVATPIRLYYKYSYLDAEQFLKELNR
jgi:hypothetical protein